MQNLLEFPSPPAVSFSENNPDTCKPALTHSAPSPLMHGLRWVYGQHFTSFVLPNSGSAPQSQNCHFFSLSDKPISSYLDMLDHHIPRSAKVTCQLPM